MTLTSTVNIPSLTQDPLTITMGISTGLGFKGIYRQQNRLATCAKFCQSLSCLNYFILLIINGQFAIFDKSTILRSSVLIRFLLLFCCSQVFVRLRDEALPCFLRGILFQGWKYERIPRSQVGCCAPVHSSSQ